MWGGGGEMMSIALNYTEEGPIHDIEKKKRPLFNQEVSTQNMTWSYRYYYNGNSKKFTTNVYGNHHKTANYKLFKKKDERREEQNEQSTIQL